MGDFQRAPVNETHRLLDALGAGIFWGPEAEDRVREAAKVQYQTSGQKRGKRPDEVFGSSMLTRIVAAVRARAELLGYGSSMPSPSEMTLIDKDWPAIDVPPVPERASGC